MWKYAIAPSKHPQLLDRVTALKSRFVGHVLFRPSTTVTDAPARHPDGSRFASVTERYSGVNAALSLLPSSERPVREPCSTTGFGSKTSAFVVARSIRFRTWRTLAARESTST